MPIKIKVVECIKKICFGCSVFGPYLTYEGDSTPWCKECFVTEEMLEDVKAKMPSWQKKTKVKCRVVPFIAFK